MLTPRINYILFILFALLALAVFTAALLSPAVRGLAYAPLRELVLPPPVPIELAVLYSTEKEAWLEEVVPQFEAQNFTYNGRPIHLRLDKSGSREMYLAVLDGSAQPDVISPASSLQISILENLSRSKFGAPVVNLNDQRACRSVVTTPLVLVAWQEHAQVLWGDNPNSNLWQSLYTALVSPEGWAAFGHPEWSYIKFGHTDPTKSNSGFMTVLLMTYNYFGKTDGLTAADILSNTEFQTWLKEFEASVPEFGDSTGTYMRDIVAYGPSKYDIVAVYEATAIEQIENARGRYGDLHVYYPPATVLSDHPFCILQTEWVIPEKEAAAQIFIEFLLSREAQESAMLRYGFRPVDTTVALDQPGSPFLEYTPNGISLNLPPEVALPEGNVLDTLLTFWIRNIQR